VALLLALFGLRYRVNQIVVGVVLNVLVSGLTGFLFSTFLSSSPSLNRALRLPTLAVPLLSRIPIIGPVLFRQTILVYLMYAAVAVLSVMLFRSRWGLRLRACGEHPKAADTVGINVMRTRVANLALAGALAGLGGAFFTAGSGPSFRAARRPAAPPLPPARAGAGPLPPGLSGLNGSSGPRGLSAACYGRRRPM